MCTLAIWHDPLFSSGRVHGSHRHVQPFWETLYRYGADVVINGHEHNYERFAPQTPEGESDPDYGIRQFVAGTGGESHYRESATLAANSEAADDNTYGVLKLTLRPSSYEWEFIPEPRGRFPGLRQRRVPRPSPRLLTDRNGRSTRSQFGSSVKIRGTGDRSPSMR